MPNEQLQRAVAARGETQLAFARRVGISPGYLSRLLSGQAIPSLEMAVKLAQEAGVPVESFLPAAPDENASSAA